MRKSLKKTSSILTLIFIIAGTVCGCSHHPSAEPIGPLCRVVTQVNVIYQNGPISTHRHYTSTEKMQRILNYLRLIDPYGTPNEKPETTLGSDFHIVVSYSDGCQKTYQQKSDRFMRIDGGDWKRIDPNQAEELSQIVGQMESDGQL